MFQYPYEGNGVARTYGTPLPAGYGRVAGGSREAEVQHINAMMAAVIAEYEAAEAAAKALPQPYIGIVGRWKRYAIYLVRKSWEKRRNNFYRWLTYRTPNRLLDWYFARRGSLKSMLRKDLVQAGITDATFRGPFDQLNAGCVRDPNAYRRNDRVFPVSLDYPDEVRAGFTPEGLATWRASKGI